VILLDSKGCARISYLYFRPVEGSTFPSNPTLFGRQTPIKLLKFEGGFVPEETLSTVLSENAASGLSYVTFVPALVFLLTGPYNQNLVVRFHAWQSVFLNLASLAACMGLYTLGVIPIINLVDVILIPLVLMIFFVLWITLMVGTLQGRRVKLPFLGDLAEDKAISRRR
jgi:uncharacterized membrane protein